MCSHKLSVEREAIRRNLVDSCGSSPKKTKILKAVRKAKSYKDVAKLVRANASYCSNSLSEMATLGLVESTIRGVYRQTPALRKMNIDTELAKGGRGPVVVTNKGPPPRIVKVLDIEGSLGLLEMDQEIIHDSFPLRKPFRTHVGEAYLTLENVMKRELNLPDTIFGVDVAAAANKMGVFNRPVQSETQGLVQLYNSAFLWYRNIFHHRKEEVSKEEALKIIFHADYLIKLFRRLMRLNRIIPRSDG